MKILSPFSRVKEVLPLVKAGADELYCGIVPAEWKEKFGMFDTLNRREGCRANFSCFDDLREAIRLSHGAGVPVFVVMNGLYTEKQYPLVMKIIEELKHIKADGLIISDIGLLPVLSKGGVFAQVHMGTGGVTFNSRAALFYAKAGVTRVVLDRLLTIKEIAGIARKVSSEVELEVFIMNTRCPNIDGLCTFYHGLSFDAADIAAETGGKDKKTRFYSSYDPGYGGHGCELDFSARVLNGSGERLVKEPPFQRKKIAPGAGPRKSCGACAIYDFAVMNISCLKIVERGMPLREKVADTRFVRGALRILSDNPGIGRQEFIRKVRRLYCVTYKYSACSGFSCYYPSVLNTAGGG